MSTAVYPSGSNTYVPEATKQFQVEFSRNPNNFALPNYTQIVPVTKEVGYYLDITVEQAGRVIDTNLEDTYWADGSPSPEFNDELESFRFQPYKTRRRARGFNIGDLSSGQASWDVVASNGRFKAQQMMTGRTVKVNNLLQTSGTWDPTHTSDVASISGNTGRWDQSTTARADIKRSINTAVELILKDTLSVVEMQDLRIVMSPNCARQISESQEIIDFIKGTPDAWESIHGETRRMNRNQAFGLPTHLYGVELVIEKTVYVSSRKGATVSKSYACASTKPYIVSRPGGIVGPTDSMKSFSTSTLFMLEEMTVEQHREHDNWDRRLVGRVTDNWDNKVTAPVSGYLFTTAVA